MPVSLILGLEPALDLASIVLRRFRRPAYSSHLARFVVPHDIVGEGYTVNRPASQGAAKKGNGGVVRCAVQPSSWVSASPACCSRFPRRRPACPGRLPSTGSPPTRSLPTSPMRPPTTTTMAPDRAHTVRSTRLPGRMSSTGSALPNPGTSRSKSTAPSRVAGTGAICSAFKATRSPIQAHPKPSTFRFGFGSVLSRPSTARPSRALSPRAALSVRRRRPRSWSSGSRCPALSLTRWRCNTGHATGRSSTPTTRT